MNIPDSSFLVLTALIEGPRHGYGILQEIDAMTSGRTRPPVATVYRTLERLTADGLVEEDSTEVVDGRFRRTYRLTEPGASLLAAEATVRASTARLATKRLRNLASRPGIEPGLLGGLA